MAGSFNHLHDNGIYQGTALLENGGDLKEAIEEMAFILLNIRRRWGGTKIIEDERLEFAKCQRGEKPWPDWWQPEEEGT